MNIHGRWERGLDFIADMQIFSAAVLNASDNYQVINNFGMKFT